MDGDKFSNIKGTLILFILLVTFSYSFSIKSDTINFLSDITKSDNSNLQQISPETIPPMPNPIKRIINHNEELIPIISAKADSTYIIYSDGNIVNKYDAKNIINEEDFWCSSGNHGTKEEVTIQIDFQKSHRVTALWLYWAFVPGEYRIRYSNDNIFYTDLFPEGFVLSIPKGDTIWWKKKITNPNSRWNHRSFDNRIELENSIYAKHFQFIMRIPVNHYFGIYRIEVYKKSKSIVMLKSKLEDQELCLSPANGMALPNTYIIATNCEDAISYGDNRELFVLNSNNYITTYNNNMCLESPSTLIDILDCGLSEDYRDDRNKWLLEANGYIRFQKSMNLCLTVADNSYNNYVSKDNIEVEASNTQSDNNHNPISVIEYELTTLFWASNPTKNDVVFMLYLKNFPITLKEMKISWKFPAKHFIVYLLLQDGFWKQVYKEKNNREIQTLINIKSQEVKGIKIILKESTTKLDDKDIYGISNIYLINNGRYVLREECKDRNHQKWEIIDISYLQDTDGQEYKKSIHILNKTKESFISLIDSYKKIPEKIRLLKEKNIELHSKINVLKETMNSIKEKLSPFETMVNENIIKSSLLGSSQYYPSIDCNHIKIAFPHKRNGLYWIKNDCMESARRVYCDFDEGLDYYLMVPEETVTEPENIRDACGSKGFEPLDYNSAHRFQNVIKLIRLFKIKFENKSIIPIAEDFNCGKDSKICSGEFRSFNSVYNPSINSLLGDLEDLNKNENIVGFIDGIKIKAVKMDKFNTIAFLCSTNSEKINDIYHLDLDCETSLNTPILKDKDNSFTAICPKSCVLNKTPVYGTNIYTDNSSICRAAVHSGEINDSTGGIIQVILERGYDKYEGSVNNYVESFDYSEPWKRSFRVKLYVPYCPNNKYDLDIYQNLADLNENSEDNSDDSSNEELSNDNNINNSTSTNVTSFISLEEMIDQDNSQLEDVIKYLKYTELRKKLKKFGNLMKFTQNKTEDNPLTPISHPKIEMLTDNALIQIENNMNKEKLELSQLSESSDNFVKFVGKLNSEINDLLDDKTIGIQTQLDKLNMYKENILGIRKLLFKIDIITMHHISRSEYEVSDLKKKIANLFMNDIFIEKYDSENIFNNYRIFYSMKGQGNQPIWDYYNYYSQGHNKVIKQINNFIDDRTGTHLVLKNKEFYDFELRCSFLINSEGAFGIAFRYDNEYTYYVYEVSVVSNKGLKRVRKFKKGVPTLLDLKYDGGYNLNTWTNIKIRAEQSIIRIYSTVSLENDLSSLDRAFEPVFTIIDNEFVRGTIAFTSMNISYLLIDNISIVQIPCIDFSHHVEYSIITNSCNNYLEDFRHINSKWESIETGKINDGPVKWDTVSELDGRDMVLFQDSKAYNVGDNEEGIIYILKDKFCDKGLFRIKFKAIDDGSIGIIFKYKDENNFYIFELFKELIRMRKKVNGEFKLLKQNQIKGYELNQWAILELIVDNNKFNCFLKRDVNKIESEQVISNVIDYDLKIGNLGLWTYKTPAYFDHIELVQNNNEIYIDVPEEEKIKDDVSLDKYTNIIDKVNNQIRNFTWKTCFNLKNLDDRVKECTVLFSSSEEVERCKKNFCKTCCDKFIESGMKSFKYLCEKQCQLMETPLDNIDTWKKCTEEDDISHPLYETCDKLQENKRCKLDMCRLCCVKFDLKNPYSDKSLISNTELKKCHIECIKKFNNYNKSP